MKNPTETYARAVKEFNRLRESAVKKEMRVTEAVNSVIDKFPEITRPELCNAAKDAGVNVLTARNVWDKRHRNG